MLSSLINWLGVNGERSAQTAAKCWQVTEDAPGGADGLEQRRQDDLPLADWHAIWITVKQMETRQRN